MLATHIPALLGAAAIAGLLTMVYARIRRNQRLAKLGARPPSIPSNFFGMCDVYLARQVMVFSWSLTVSHRRRRGVQSTQICP